MQEVMECQCPKRGDLHFYRLTEQQLEMLKYLVSMP